MLQCKVCVAAFQPDSLAACISLNADDGTEIRRNQYKKERKERKTDRQKLISQSVSQSVSQSIT